MIERVLPRNVLLLTVLLVLTTCLPTAAQADNILAVIYSTYGPQAAYANLRAALIAGGHTVTQLEFPAEGQIAATLAVDSFDQVFFWDVTQSLALTSEADKDALRDWYHDHGNGTICIDTRSLGLLFYAALEQPLIINIAATFQSMGGGLWIGCDHGAYWVNNANALLSHLGYGTCQGQYSNALTDYTSASPIFNTPNHIALQDLNWDFTVSNAPVGTYLDGVEIVPLAWVNASLQYMSGSRNLLSPLPTPTPAPVPAASAAGLLALSLLTGALLAGATGKRSRQG